MSTSKRFFKVILCATIHDHKLRIPDVFVQKHRNELAELVTLTVPGGGVWRVRVEQTDKAAWLHEGLLKFMEDHCIEFGYILMFKYKGNSTFKVNIFDLRACEIEYNKSSDSAKSDDEDLFPKSVKREDDNCQRYESDDLPTSDQQEEGDDDNDDDDSSIEYLGSSMDYQLLGEPEQSSEFATRKRGRVVSAERRKLNRCYLTRNKKVKIQDKGGREVYNTPPRRNKVYQSNNAKHEVMADRTAKSVSSKKANRKIKITSSISAGSKVSSHVYSAKSPMEVQSNRATRPTNMSRFKAPTYKVTLKSYNCEKSILNLPSGFVSFFMPHSSQFIKLQDNDGNEWDVRCIARKPSGFYLSGGWTKFVQEKNLRTGDVCVFKPYLIDGEIKLKVKISYTY